MNRHSRGHRLVALALSNNPTSGNQKENRGNEAENRKMPRAGRSRRNLLKEIQASDVSDAHVLGEDYLEQGAKKNSVELEHTVTTLDSSISVSDAHVLGEDNLEQGAIKHSEELEHTVTTLDLSISVSDAHVLGEDNLEQGAIKKSEELEHVVLPFLREGLSMTEVNITQTVITESMLATSITENVNDLHVLRENSHALEVIHNSVRLEPKMTATDLDRNLGELPVGGEEMSIRGVRMSENDHANDPMIDVHMTRNDWLSPAANKTFQDGLITSTPTTFSGRSPFLASPKNVLSPDVFWDFTETNGIEDFSLPKGPQAFPSGSGTSDTSFASFPGFLALSILGDYEPSNASFPSITGLPMEPHSDTNKKNLDRTTPKGAQMIQEIEKDAISQSEIEIVNTPDIAVVVGNPVDDDSQTEGADNFNIAVVDPHIVSEIEIVNTPDIAVVVGNPVDDGSQAESANIAVVDPHVVSGGEEHDESVDDPTNIVDNLHNQETGAPAIVDNQHNQETGAPAKRKIRNYKERANAKKLKNSGKEYETSTGKIKGAKCVREVACKKQCTTPCLTKVTQQQREEIHSSFWLLGQFERQGDFICRCVKSVPCKYHRRPKNGVKENNRNFTYIYYLPLKSESGEDVMVEVCRDFFLSTLDITARKVHIAKQKETCGVAKEDQRGRHPPQHKVPVDKVKAVKSYLASIPKMESHYCRAKTSRLYLPPETKNLSNLYRLYMASVHIDLQVKKSVFRKIYKTLNLSIHRPKKDACRICEQYKLAKDKTDKLEETYQLHMKNKDKARAAKTLDKERSHTDESFRVYTFDLQSVLYCPCSDVSSFFYTRKFCVYNLTVYDLNSKGGYCYLWDETAGMRGSDEVGTCLLTHLRSVPLTVKHIALYSDSCGGQNRNRFIASLLLYLVRELHFEEIDLNFLETGHTDMEVDSMHSAIEHAKKNEKVFVPAQYIDLIKAARKNAPYHVNVLKHDSFVDLKDLKDKLTSSTLKIGSNKENVPWMKIKRLQFRKARPDVIFYKVGYDDEEFMTMPAPLIKKRRRRRDEVLHAELKSKYRAPLPVTHAKKKDLVNLCTTNPVIPEEYRHFYLNLPALPSGSKRTADRLPEPDVQDPSEEEEEEEEED